MGSRVFFQASPWKGQFDLKGKSSPTSPSWVVVVVVVVVEVRGGGIFSSPLWKIRLRSIREAVKGLQDPGGDGWRHKSSWTPGSSGHFPGRLPGWFGNVSLEVCGNVCGEGHGCPGSAGEPRGVGREEPPWPPGPRACITPALRELGWLSSSRRLPVGQESAWRWVLEPTTVPFTSSGPGRWRTPRRTARAWGLAAWGSG